MSFYALRFLFNGKSSEDYSLTISSESAEQSSANSGDVQLYTEKIYRRPDEFLIGTSPSPVLEFNATVMTTDLNELTATDSRLISKWLFGHQTYKKLQIIQPDMSEEIYDCFLLQPKIVRIGNTIKGYSFTVHSRLPWAITEPKSYTYTTSPIKHNNSSDNTGYTYPTTIITVDSFGGDITITNTTDNNRQSIFTGLSANEVLTIDNSLQILSSSTGLKRLSTFNKKFFRLLSGVNNLTMTGAISSLKITYENARKIGG